MNPTGNHVKAARNNLVTIQVPMPEQPVQVSGKFGQSLYFAIAIRTEQVIFFKGPLACTQFREAWVIKHIYAISGV